VTALARPGTPSRSLCAVDRRSEPPSRTASAASDAADGADLAVPVLDEAARRLRTVDG
jgi:hypothetical protein